ncbi:MAG: hypothetical protein V1790_13215 [Planctomycetota bacterium]
MTVLAAAESRGSFFEPITLGLHAPTDFSELRKYRDDISVRGGATFVHELAHYLQFYGTIFGYNYLLATRACSICLQDGMTSMSGVEGLTFPAATWPIDLARVFPSQKDRDFYTQAILLNRYYNEELYGYTYNHFGRSNMPVRVDGYSVLTSPLYLELHDGTVFPFTGETLLENWAVCQETQFLSSSVPHDFANRFIEATYLSLPSQIQARYVGIAMWFATYDLTEIEPLLYFTLLNQPQEGFLERLGDYTLAFHTKKLLTRFRHLADLSRPTTDNEVREVLNRIAEVSGLADPLQTLAKGRDLLKSTAHSDSWVVDWISWRIWDWFLEEPLRILTWPENLQSVLKGIPLVKLHFANRSDGETLNVLNVAPNELKSEQVRRIKRHHDYAERLHVITGLYNQASLRCPHVWDRMPDLCESCKVCSGTLPDEKIGDDCPVMQRHGDLIGIAGRGISAGV